jgi:hypothetical protein
MRKRIAKQQQIGRRASPGDQMYLEDGTPHGLFEACNGNRYIVTEDLGPVAIALRHRFLPPFTWEYLDEQLLEYGRWLGPYRLLVKEFASRQGRLGTIKIERGNASLTCPGHTGHLQPIHIGLFKTKGRQFFAGWEIECLATKSTFFEWVQRKSTKLVLTPLD